MSHEASNLDGVDTVVYSTAIPQDHLELVEARRRGLRVMHRSEALAAAMTGPGDHRGGRHPRQDHHHLDHDGDPAARRAGPVVRDRRRDLRGRLERPPRHRPAFRGRGRRERQVVPDLPAARRDHHQHRGRPPQQLGRPGRAQGRLPAVRRAHRRRRFRGHLRTTTRACRSSSRRCGPADGPSTRTARRRAPTCASPAWCRPSRVSGTRPSCDGEPLGEIRLALPGRHMGLNSAAAVLTALKLGVPREQIAEALASFPGVRRRFERKGMAAGVRVYDEYAYHPTSVKAALRTLREVAGDGRLVVVFQPYRRVPHPRPAGRAGRGPGHRRRGDRHGGFRAGRGPRSRERVASR